ncbi:MAG: hypothetical protein QY323_05230 [Patescibacteria group bacterium]|nr:MAG: hypothetical protein QY323_05230 [Patescibacteria group bacterium]
MKKRTPCLLILTVLSACQSSPDEGSELPDGYVRATLPATESGIEYAHLDTPEMLPVGPSGIFSVKDGYAVADNVRGSIVILNDDFKVTREVNVKNAAQGILSVASDGEDLVALDGYALTPKLLRIGPNGDIKSKDITLNSTAGPTGLVKDDVGMILEYGGGETLYRIDDLGASLGLEPIDHYVWNGIAYSVDKPTETYFHERTVRIGSHAGVVRVPNHLGSVQLIGSDGDGGVYALVEDVTLAHTISVEQSVWHFSSTGEALSVSKVPLRERLTYVTQGVALDEAGEPVALVPQRGDLQFWSLTTVNASAITARKPSKLPGEVVNDLGTTAQGLVTYNGSCLTSAQIASNANEYKNVSQPMTSNNVNNNGSCTSRTKPSYLTVGVNSPVSYDWGGWDTPSAFQSAMNAGGKAGNVNTAATLTCSYGADCSGFVTRVWGWSDFKRSTTTLDDAVNSTPVYGPGFLTGEIYNLAGSHTAIYNSTTPSGPNIWEAAGEPYGRVVYRTASWSYVSGYSTYHGVTHCW